MPRGWELKKVKHLVSFITSGPRGWSDLLTTDGGSVFLQSGDLDDFMNVHCETAQRVQPPLNAEGRRTKLQSGDVLVCITGAKTGRVAFMCEATEETYINQHLALLRPQGQISSEFLALFLYSYPSQKHFQMAQYGLKEGLGLTEVAESNCLVPSLDEQRRVVNEVNRQLDPIDRATEASIASIKLFSERRAALISAAVTGKIDVRNWQPPESGQPQKQAAEA